mgnify:CR=1 FL=1
MIKLTYNNTVDDYFLRIIKRDNEDVWDLYLADWHGLEDETKALFPGYKPVQPISMKREDLLNFAKELKDKLDKLPEQEVELDLTFYENKPQFKFKIVLMNKKYHENWHQDWGKIQISVGFNAKFSAVKKQAYDMQYLYEGKGQHSCISQKLDSKEVLESFVKDLELEAR